MPTEKPLPCPFCGAEPTVFRPSGDRNRADALVRCGTPGCVIHPMTVLLCEPTEDGMRRWNTRAGSNR